MGRSDGGQKQMLQTHINFTAQDKVVIAAHYMSPDYNQGAYEIEYNRKFDRITVDLKTSTMGNFSFSGVSALNKGTFLPS